MSSSSTTAQDKENDKDKGSFDPSPREEWTLISQGAEARVWKLPCASQSVDQKEEEEEEQQQQQQQQQQQLSSSGDTGANGNNPTFVICKERFSKAYRHPDLDVRLTKSRCRSEAKLLEKCASKSKIRVPKVLRVSPPSLYLEYLNGPSVKSYLQQQQLPETNNGDLGKESNNKSSDSGNATMTNSNDNHNDNDNDNESVLARQMGRLLGRLHNIGIVHGDLTTSNMILLENKGDGDGDKEDSPLTELALIDFGLSKSTTSVEEQAVDLYVLERALLSTHPDLSDGFFDRVLDEYKLATTELEDDDANAGNGNGKKRKSHHQTTLQRLEQVRMRGRKRECFG